MQRLIPLLLATSFLTANLGAQSSVGPVKFAGQVSLGVLGMPVGFVGGGLLTRRLARSMGQDEDAASSLAMVGAYSGAALTTAIGPTLLAARGARASYLKAVGGAAVGGLGSFLIVKLNKRGEPDARKCRAVCLASTAAIFLLPSVGATIAANSSRH